MYKLFTTHKVVLILDFKEQMIFSGNDSLKKKRNWNSIQNVSSLKSLPKLYFQAAKALAAHIHGSFFRIAFFLVCCLSSVWQHIDSLNQELNQESFILIMVQKALQY